MPSVGGGRRRANCPHGFEATLRLFTVPPFAGEPHVAVVTRPATLEELPSPNGCVRRTRPRRRVGRAVSPWTYRPALSRRPRRWANQRFGRARNGVGLSPVSEVGHCDQATPPSTPRARGKNPHHLPQRQSRWTAPVLRHEMELSTHPRPKRDASRPVPVWPPRHRPLLDDAGCTFPWEVNRDFWTRTASPR